MDDDHSAGTPRSFASSALIRPRVGRYAVHAAAWIVPGMMLIVAVGTWLAFRHHLHPVWGIWIADACAGFLTVFVVWPIVLFGTNLGVALEDDGIRVYERTVRPGKSIERVVKWDELRGPTLERDGNVLFRTNSFPVDLSPD